jgi:hypothetical protein
MSNGVAKLLAMPPKIREVDLLLDFYRCWRQLHKRKAEGCDMEEAQVLAQDLVDASHQIEAYRNRHVR